MRKRFEVWRFEWLLFWTELSMRVWFLFRPLSSAQKIRDMEDLLSGKPRK